MRYTQAVWILILVPVLIICATKARHLLCSVLNSKLEIKTYCLVVNEYLNFRSQKVTLLSMTLNKS